MTDVTENRDQAEAELSAADERVLRELTERARTGGLQLTGEGGLLGRLTKMVVEGQCHVEERDRAFRADAALSDAACGVFDGE